jgi:hypothetical protein
MGEHGEESIQHYALGLGTEEGHIGLKRIIWWHLVYIVCRDLPAHPVHKLDAPKDSMVCLGNIQYPKLTRYDTHKYE